MCNVLFVSFGFIADLKARANWCFIALEWFGLAMPGKFRSRTSTGILSGVNQLSRAPAMLSQHCETTDWHHYLLCDLFISHLTEQLMSKLDSDDRCRLIQVKFLQQLSQVIFAVLKHMCKLQLFDANVSECYMMFHVHRTKSFSYLQWKTFLLPLCHKLEHRDHNLKYYIRHCGSTVLMAYLTYHTFIFFQIRQVTDKKERKRKIKEFKSYAKSILSLPENRNNEVLWLCYACCNRELGKICS